MGEVLGSVGRTSTVIVARLNEDPKAWEVQQLHADVATLHALGIQENAGRVLRWCHPTDAALVLGRSQPGDDVDQLARERAGINLVRRSSGGGAVLVVPDEILWFDVLLPVGDPLWQQDVNRAFWWLGETVARTLHDATGGDFSVHRGPLVSNRWSKAACLAGLGPGEVLRGSAKAVGISQRRTRAGAMFQCSVSLAPATPLADLLVLDPAEREELRAHLDIGVAVLPDLWKVGFPEALVHNLAVDTST